MTGGVTVIQRFGSMLNLNVHVRTLMIDGVYAVGPGGAVMFHPLPAPTDADVAAIAERIFRKISKKGIYRRRAGMQALPRPNACPALVLLIRRVSRCKAPSARKALRALRPRDVIIGAKMASFYTGGCAVLVLALGCGGGGASPVDAGGGGSPAGGTGSSSVAGTGGSIATGGEGGGAGASSAAIVLAADEDSPTTIAIDATDVYWNTSGAIRRVPKTGGPVTTVYASVPGYELAVDDGYVFWFQGSATAFKDLVRAPKGGGGDRTTIATLTESGGGLVIDADAVYWIQSDGPNAVLMRLPKAGGVAPTPLVSQLAIGGLALGALAVDDGYVYWNRGASGTVQRIAKTGGAVQDVVSGGYAVGTAVPDATDVYYVGYHSGLLPGDVKRAPKNGGPSTVLATGLNPVRHLALASDAVYVLVSFESPAEPGYVAKVLKSQTGGDALKLVTDTTRAHALAVDAQYVFWTETGADGARDGQIRRIAR